MLRHSPILYCFREPCAAQGLTFKRKADLEQHTAAMHTPTNAPLVDCEHHDCPRRGQWGFKRRQEMVEHMDEAHKVVVPKQESGERN